MSAQVLVNAKLWCAGFDWTGDVNALGVKLGAEALDTTVLGQGTRTRTPGLKSFSVAHEGFWSGGANAVDDAIFNSVFGVQNSVMTIDPQASGAEGDIVYTGKVDVATYTPGAAVGKMLAFQVAGDGDSELLVRGTLMKNGAVTVTGNGNPFQLGAVSAAQKIYAALHVLDPITGTTPTLNVKLQSAPASNFAAPTDRITFTQVTTSKGAQWGVPLAGAISDTWWRFVWTLTGTTPSYPIVCAAGIMTP